VFEPSSKDYRARNTQLGSTEVCFGHGGVDGDWKEDFQLFIRMNPADDALLAFIHHRLAYFEAVPRALILLDQPRFSISESQLGQQVAAKQKSKPVG
jgi:hypothetical protein